MINPIVYAELVPAFSSVNALDGAIADMELIYAELPRAALFLAGKAFLQYRKQGGSKQNVLPDFFHWRACRCTEQFGVDERYPAVFDLFSDCRVNFPLTLAIAAAFVGFAVGQIYKYNSGCVGRPDSFARLLTAGELVSS